MFKGATLGRTIGTACATWAVGLPVALVASLYGLDGLIWLLERLPQ